MSNSSSTADGGGVDWAEMRETAREWGHLPALALVVLVMFLIRIQSWQRFVRKGTVYLAGNDPWYHLRQVRYSTEHWLATMPFDVFTGFPAGANSGQFGTLFDQLIAAAALLLGLGTPASELVRTVVAFSPAVFGSLVAVPTFLIARRFGSNWDGLLAAAVLALLPGLFLQRGTVGSADHNVAEPLFMSLAVLGLLVAISVGERERPVWEQLLERDVAGLRDVLGWSLLAGVATAAYMWLWPPGVLLVGIVGIFLLVSLSSDVVGGTSPDHVAVPVTIAMTTTGVLMLVPLRYLSFSATGYTLLQVFTPLLVAAGGVFLAWLAREWERRDIEPDYYPVVVGGLVLAGFAVGTVVVPGIVDLIVTNLIRVVGMTTAAATRTISEAQPFLKSMSSRLGIGAWKAFFLEYGATFYTALAGSVWMLLRPHLLSDDTRRVGLGVGFLALGGLLVAFPIIPSALGGLVGLNSDLTALLLVTLAIMTALVYGEYPSGHILLVIWSAFMLAAALTQIRFNYYLVVPVSVMTAYAVGAFVRRMGITADSLDPGRIEWSHVMVLATIALLVFAPLVAPITFTNRNGRQIPMSNAIEVGAHRGPGAVTQWEDPLSWMANNTPAEGNYGGAGNADQLDYQGTYAIPEDGNYNYPTGSYGVMSWWDYGHWITVLGNRIPVANPFQQHATVAANYLLAPTETAANNVLESLDETDAKTRYVAIDYKMVAPQSKFGAMAVFYSANKSLSYGDMVAGRLYNPGARNWITLKTQRYYRSMLVRLYRYHGSRIEAQPVVVDWANRNYKNVDRPIPTFNGTRRFRTMEAAREYVSGDRTSTIGGIADLPKKDIPALEHYRLVRLSGDSLVPRRYIRNYEFRPSNLPTWVKIFERVPGATVRGTAPANTTVTATVEIRTTAALNDSTFTYTQQAKTGPDGQFTMTLPYSTTGYANWGVEAGYTNVSARATGPYRFSTPATINRTTMNITRYTATAHVPEGAVIGEIESPITVELHREVIRSLGTPATNRTATNRTATNRTATNGTETNGTAGNDTATNRTVTNGTASRTATVE
ncbi:MAG: oligosaccharyl transferase, archaeosortase A system-associated [Halodesulfurarchaeum sp.]